MERPSSVASSTSSWKRRPRQVGQGACTSLKKSRLLVTVPMPSHVSQRPPGVLNENAFAESPRERASGAAAKAARMGAHTSAYVATFERFMRAMGVCSTATMRSRCPQPDTTFSGPAASPCARTSNTRVDLPEPDGPVTVTRHPAGMSASRWSRLNRVALRISIGAHRGVHGAALGASGRARKRPVAESGAAARSASDPSATTRPPQAPAPGPRSTRWSAARMTSRSCSMTSTVLPRSRRFRRMSTRPSVSRGCRPAVGSSRM